MMSANGKNLNSEEKTRRIISNFKSNIQTPERRHLLSSNSLENRVKYSMQVQSLVVDDGYSKGNSSNDTDSAISIDHQSSDGFFKLRPKYYWNSRRKNTSQDSESESAPLLSSEELAGAESVMFYESETSDVDLSFSKSFPRYGTVAATNFNPSATRTSSKRLPVKVHNNLEKTSPRVFYEQQCYNPRGNQQIPCGNKAIDEAILPPLLNVLPKQNSLVTIFSIWNTILGSSLLTMPWGILMAGLIPGISLILIMAGLCLYTAYRLLQVHKYHGGLEGTEVPELCRIFLGPFAGFSAKLFSIAVLLGANIAYWILMSNCLYNSVNFIYDKIAGYDMYSQLSNDTAIPEVLCPKEISFNSTQVVEKSFDNLGPIWDLYKTVPFFLGIIMFPLLNFNSTTFFTKFNSLGTAAIGYVIFIVICKSAKWGVHMDGFTWETSWQLRPTFPALCGMLALSFFIHNIIITIMQHNQNQNNNGRDLTIAYFLVTLTYIVVGLSFYISFPLAKSCIEDNFLNNFQKWDVLTVGARIVLFFQLLTVYPLITYMLRIRILTTLYRSQNFSRIYVVIINAIVTGICMIFARFLPYVGTVIRYTGAISGLVYVFTLPSVLHLVILYRKGGAKVSSVILHLSIPTIGIANLVAQLFVSAH